MSIFFTNSIINSLLILDYCWSALVGCAMVANISPSSVRCPCFGHISETKQDLRMVRPILRNNTEVGTADSVAAFRSSSRRHRRAIF